MNATDKIIQTEMGAILVSASAGSGKTHQLTKRFLHLLTETDTQISQILAITFTDAAAAEMKTRIYTELLKASEDPTCDEAKRQKLLEHRLRFGQNRISTIHSFCQSVLREQPDALAKMTFPLDPFSPQGPSVSPDRGFVLIDSFSEQTLTPEWRAAFLKHYATDETLVQWLSTETTNAVQTYLDQMLRVDDALLKRQSELSLDAWRILTCKELTWLLNKYRTALKNFVRLAVENEHIFSKRIEEPTEAWALEIISLSTNGINKTKLAKAFKTDVPYELAEAAAAFSQIVNEISKTLGVDKTEIGNIDATAWCADIGENAKTIFGRREYAAYRQSVALAKCGARWKAWMRFQRFTNRFIDHDDSIQLVQNLFASQPEIARLYRDRFLHIMVDEFQDTDRAQWDIIRLIHDAPRRPGDSRETSLLLVGDLKQAIYAFRGGEVSVMKQVAADVPQLKIVSLPASYRSNQTIVNFVNILFKRLLPKASEAPSYQAVFETTTLPEEPNDKQRTLGAIRYLHLQSTAWGQAFPPDLLAQVKTETPETWEAARAAYFLKKLRESENVAPEWKAIGDLLKARKKTVGVLLRSKKNIPEWVRVFRKFGFVTEAWSGGSFFEKPEIVDLYLLLRFLADREDTWALVGVLRSPWVNLSDAALALLKNALDADALAGHRNSWFGFLHSGNWKQTALDEIDHKALEHALSWMEKASSEIRFRRCSDVLLELINHVAPEAGYDDEEQARRNLLQAVNAVREQENAGRSSVFEIAEFFRLNRENASDVAETPSGDEAEVYIMTIHKSKGLEFPLVILGEPGPKAGGGLALDITPIDAPFDDGNQRDIRLVLAVTPDESAESEDQRNYRSLLLNRVRQLNKNRELAEVVRLFYVAVTRAESHFMLINHENWDRNSSEAFLKLWLPVSNEVLEEAGITKMGDFLSAGDVVFSPDEAAAILPMLEHPEMELTKPFDASIRQEVVQTLERLHINSAFAHRKPRKVTEVIRAEGAPMVEYAPDDFETGEDAEAPRYRGTIVHKLLEWMAAGAEPDAGLVERAALVTGLPAGDPGEAVRQAGAAWKALSKRFPGARRFVTEHAFLADLGSETGLLNGVADLLVEDAKGDWWLVDYKTSALHSGFTEHAEKAGYLKQLDVYAEAYKRLFNLEIPPARRLLLFTFPEEPVFINAE